MTSPPVHIAAPAALYNGGREGKPTAASVTGIIPDPDNAAVPGAKIVLHKTQSGTVSEPRALPLNDLLINFGRSGTVGGGTGNWLRFLILAAGSPAAPGRPR